MSQREIDKLAPADRPWMSNYPKLHEWIHEKHEARCLTQDAVGTSYFEKYLVNGRVVLVEVLPNKGGFYIWTMSESNEYAEIFADAERRVGIVP